MNESQQIQIDLLLNPKYNQGNSRVFTHAEGNLLAKVYDA